MEYEGILMKSDLEDSKELWNEYYKSYRKDVLYIAFSCVHDLYQADDITQDVFLKLYRTILKKKEIVNIRSWLYKATVRTCLDFKKSFWNRIFSKRNDINKEIPFLQENKFEEDENFKNLNENLNKLPKKQKIAISLRFYKEMQIKEIADLMGISESSVKTHISRGLKKLRMKMEGKNETY